MGRKENTVEDLYLEDFTVGRRFETGGLTITESEIINFAFQYDPQPFHLELPAAETGPFSGMAASGFHTLGVTFRLWIQTGAFRACSLGAIGIDEVRWLLPVRPGDTVRVLAEVLEARPSSSKPDRGIARIKYTTINQKSEPVMTMIGIHILKRRPD